ncbi:MAG: acylglycerol kinase family protein, partial [Candidatus Enteromonas sp.]|nr:acylglycerol kinase family protein [Candidatus Enteromonas sp.]
MNRALLLVSGNAGRGLFAKHGKDMLKRLHPLFSCLEVVESFDLLEAEKLVKDKSQEIDTLIVVGGDGSFYNVINWLSKEKKKPTLAYINGGTMGDVGKNFGISKNY